MDIIKNYLLEKGFKSNQKNSFTFSYTLEGFAQYNILITSYNNWVFRMEMEKKSLSNGVVGFSNHTCFLGIISSSNPINVLDIILTATGIREILEFKKSIKSERHIH